jgi:hypothetical protein
MAEPAEGDMAVNPTTGERLQFIGGKWGPPQIPLNKLSLPEQIQRGAEISEFGVPPEYMPQWNAQAGEALKGIPVIGAAVPTTPEMKELEEKHPINTQIQRTLGGTMALAPLGATSIGAKILGVAPEIPLLAKPFVSAASGAGLSAADAAARGEDPRSAAAVGGGIGAVVPVVGGIASRGVQATAKAIGERLGVGVPETLKGVDPLALRWARTAAKADGLSEEQIAKKMSELGPQGFVMDYGPNLRGLAGGVAADIGEGKSLVFGALDARTAAARATVDKALDNTLGPKINVPEYSRHLMATRKAAADPEYEAFRNMTVHPTPELQGIMPRLQAAGALDQGLHLMDVEGNQALKPMLLGGPNTQGRTAVPTAETWDYAKRGLDEVIEASKPWGSSPSPNKLRVYSDLKSDLMRALENHPDPRIAQQYAAARQAYAEPTGIMNALRDGQEWRTIHKDELPYLLKNYSTLEQRAFLQGVRSDLDDMLMDSARGGTRVRAFFEAPSNQEKLQTLTRMQAQMENQGSGLAPAAIEKLGRERAEALVQEMERQRTFGATKGRAIDNSETAARTAAGKMMRDETENNWLKSLKERFAYLPHVSLTGYVPGSGTLQKAVSEQAAGRVAGAQSDLGSLLTKSNPEAADIVRALQGYTVPGEVAGPQTGQIIRLLGQGANPNLRGEGMKFKERMGF